jgi:hypothetical protein
MISGLSIIKTILGAQKCSSILAKITRGGWGGEEVAQTMYTHLSKCKNDKIKK